MQVLLLLPLSKGQAHKVVGSFPTIGHPDPKRDREQSTRRAENTNMQPRMAPHPYIHCFLAPSTPPARGPFPYRIGLFLIEFPLREDGTNSTHLPALESSRPTQPYRPPRSPKYISCARAADRGSSDFRTSGAIAYTCKRQCRQYPQERRPTWIGQPTQHPQQVHQEPERNCQHRRT